ncbi:two-component system response regulator [Flavobacterium cucumis]|jgi:CheY-like chemotaxis protein|uniref:CheY chemotaxis protein or a CheY-like REC (Receiver) domain n=1 Tax=Flavobacterium cucumis TaxID=416016 RepID=A0A1M7ZWE1_9FLAO|nr:response regulator [Flavobacterium cucumis]SHO73205.1 CheY chemotaxis protein or a CheY-like REC (receiver) domain [Flavobacterium cucumis]
MTKRLKSIMIIDDNEFDCYITSKLINSHDDTIDIMEFNSSVTALQYLQEFQNDTQKLPNLIFLDIYMPLMDGFEFIEHFNQFSKVLTDYTKICIVSSTIDDYYINKAKLDANVLFTSKPISKEFIASLIF